MHASVLNWVPTALTAGDVARKAVIEAGSYDVNGSARPYIEQLSPASYIGTDMQPGPRVDVVCAAQDLPERFGWGSADVVAAFEMLEHAEDWRAALDGLITLLAPGGVLVLTTRSEGFPYHAYPGDHWRFSVEAMLRILGAAGLEDVRVEADPDPASPGVFARAVKPEPWDWPEGASAAWDEAGVTAAPRG